MWTNLPWMQCDGIILVFWARMQDYRLPRAGLRTMKCTASSASSEALVGQSTACTEQHLEKYRPSWYY
jgi:hypothetical protein